MLEIEQVLLDWMCEYGKRLTGKGGHYKCVTRDGIPDSNGSQLCDRRDGHGNRPKHR